MNRVRTRVRTGKPPSSEFQAAISAAPQPPPLVKPTYEELVKGLEQALEHLDFCGWGDNYERECSVGLQKELPALLERAKS